MSQIAKLHIHHLTKLRANAIVSILTTLSDTMAIGGYRAALALGLSIPEDVAFIGYDDIASSALLQPALTTSKNGIL